VADTALWGSNCVCGNGGGDDDVSVVTEAPTTLQDGVGPPSIGGSVRLPSLVASKRDDLPTVADLKSCGQHRPMPLETHTYAAVQWR